MSIMDLKQISKVQPMREGEIDTVDTMNAMLATFPLGTDDIGNGAITNAKLAADSVTTDKILDGTIVTADIADKAVTNAKLAADSVTYQKVAANAILTDNISDYSVTAAKLAESIQTQLSFLASVPNLEFGTSSSFSVSGSSYQDVNVAFTTNAKEPIVLCVVKHATGNLNCVVTAVTNQTFIARVYNLTTTNVSDVTLDWLTISGR